MNIESDHHRTVSLLQNQLQAAKQEIEQMKNRIEVLRQNTSESEKDATTLSNNNDQTRDDLLWNSFERQQGEVLNENESLKKQVSNLTVIF